MTLDAAITDAPIVVAGRVESTRGAWDPASGALVTYVSVGVAARVRGAGVPDRIVLKQLGGELGGVGLWVVDQASFRVGEDALLFLAVSERDQTLHTYGLSAGKRIWSNEAVTAIRLADAARATPRETPPFLAVPVEFPSLGRSPQPAFSLLPTDGGYPARWHEVDDDVPLFVDHPSALPGTWTGSTANATAAINLWRNSGMELDLRDGGASLGTGCPASFTGNGRIAVAYNDPCGVADSPETWVVGGGYYTTGELRTVGGTTYQKFLQGFVVLNNTGPQAGSAGCFQDAITHGLGHALGLGHSDSVGAMMNTLPSASCASGPRGLGADDVTGITSIYRGVASGPFPPHAPTSLTASAQLSTVTLTWTPAVTGGPAQRWIVDAGNAGSGVYNLGSIVFPTTSPTAVFNNVPPGSYFVRVRAQNAAGTSPPSAERQVTVGACVPPGPPASVAGATTNTTASLSWTPPASGVAQGYRVAVGTAPGVSNIFVGDFPATVTNVAGGLPFGTYYARVFSTNICGTSPPSTEVTLVVQPCAGPAAPTNFRFTKSGSFVSLFWSPPPGVVPTSYTVFVGDRPGASNLAVFTTAATTLGGPVGPGTYHVRVAASTACGLGAVSSDLVITVP